MSTAWWPTRRRWPPLNFALAQRGKPYQWAAEGPNSYDCSGLMWASYRSVGITLPRVARDQQHALIPVSPADLLPGDLIFFNPTSRTDWTTVSHVGMYYGDNMMIEAPTVGENVKLAHVWWSAFFSAARVVPAVPARHRRRSRRPRPPAAAPDQLTEAPPARSQARRPAPRRAAPTVDATLVDITVVGRAGAEHAAPSPTPQRPRPTPEDSTEPNDTP